VNQQTRTFLTLIKRELWEHRGGFVYTPLIVGAALVVMLLMGAGSAWFWQLKIDGAETMTAGALKLAASQVPPEQLRLGVQAFLFGSGLVWQSVMFFVLFFYCIGALYDDRRDRSVLFWKSMPVSDLETVASKVVTTVLVAPALMLVAMAIGHLVLLLVAGLLIAAHGGSPVALLWAHANPLPVWGTLLVAQAVNALFLLPHHGWLFMAGAFARGKPFLWAVLPPVVLAVVESFVGFTANFSLSKVVFEFFARRAAAGVAPISIDTNFGDDRHFSAGLSGTRYAADLSQVLDRLSTADLWIGVAIGLTFLAAAVWLRRYRDESTN
jgi:ABC-2 type transport system permease protein